MVDLNIRLTRPDGKKNTANVMFKAISIPSHMPKTLDLCPMTTRVEDQQATGTCTGWAFSTLFESMYWCLTGEKLEFTTCEVVNMHWDSLYFDNGRNVDKKFRQSWENNGCSLLDPTIPCGTYNQWCAIEALYHYNTSEWLEKHSSGASKQNKIVKTLTEAIPKNSWVQEERTLSVDEIKALLFKYNQVQICVPGHSMCADGYDESHIVCHNSWGEKYEKTLVPGSAGGHNFNTIDNVVYTTALTKLL